ncbi:hypothetical protein D3C71_1900710 [compost metagenome]
MLSIIFDEALKQHAKLIDGGRRRGRAVDGLGRPWVFEQHDHRPGIVVTEHCSTTEHTLCGSASAVNEIRQIKLATVRWIHLLHLEAQLLHDPQAERITHSTTPTV